MSILSLHRLPIYVKLIDCDLQMYKSRAFKGGRWLRRKLGNFYLTLKYYFEVI